MNLLIVCLVAFIIQAQEVIFSAYVKTTHITDNEIFDLNLEFKWIGSPQDFRMEVPSTIQFYGLERLGSGSSNKLANTDQGQQCIKTISYRLRPIRTGPVSIEKIQVKAIHTLSGKEIELSSEPIKLDVSAYVEPFRMSAKLWMAVAAAVLVIAGVVFIYLRSITKKKRDFDSLRRETVKQPEELILDELKKVKNDPDKSSETLQFFLNLYEQYLSAELIEKEKLTIGDSQITFEVNAFKNKIDLFRFSGQQTDIFELEELIGQFRELLEKNLESRLKMESK